MSQDQCGEEQNYEVQNEYEEWPEYELQSKNSNEKPYTVYDLQQLSSKIYRQNQEKCILTYLPPTWNLMLYSFCGFSSESLHNVIDQEQTGRRMIRFDEAYRPSSSIGECLICCSETQLISNPCKHSFCTACWAAHIQNSHCSRSQYELFPMCPWEDCIYRTNMLLMEKVWEDMPQLRSHFERLLCLKYAQQSDRVRLCKREGCNKAIYINFSMENLLLCECGNEVCKICGEDEHFPLNCGDLRLWNKILTENQNHWVNELVTQECPMCRTLIDKNGGCIHMRCRCNYQFCWICLKVWKGHSSFSACNSIKKEDHENRLKEQQMKRKLNQQEYLSRFEELKSQVERVQKLVQRVKTLDLAQLTKQLNDYKILTRDTSYLREIRDCLMTATSIYIKSQIYIFFQLFGFTRLEAMTKVIASQINLLDNYLAQKMQVIDKTIQLQQQKQKIVSASQTWLIEEIHNKFFEGREHHLEMLKSTRKIYEAVKAGDFLSQNSCQ